MITRGVKKYISIILTVILLLNVSPVSAASARTVSIFETEGDGVTMTKGTAKEFAARKGQRLHNGYTVTTGKTSYCYLDLDDSAILKMDERSKISVSSASRNKIAVSLLSGAALVNVEKQNVNDIIETRAGNAALTVRGTIYIVEYQEDDVLQIIMLDGAGEVNGVRLEAGQVMIVYDNAELSERVHEIIELKIDDSLSLFMLKQILEYQELLVENEILTVEDVELILELIEEFEQKADDGGDNEPDDDGTPVYPDEEEADGEEDGSESLDETGGGSETGEETQTSDEFIPPQQPDPDPDPESADTTTINTGGAITVTAPMTIPVGETATLPAGSTLTVMSGGSLTINGTLTTNGNLTVELDGTVTNNSGNTWNITGEVTNNGTIINTASGVINIQNGGVLYNNNLLTNNGTVDISPAGNLNGITGSTLVIGAGSTLNGASGRVLFQDDIGQPVPVDAGTYILTGRSRDSIAFMPEAVAIAFIADTYEGICGDNLKWIFYSNSGVLEITGTGPMSDWDSNTGPPPEWNTHITLIKSIYMPSGITTIGSQAFRGCTILESVTIPVSVTTIGREAFRGCTILESVSMPNVTTIEREAFSGTSLINVSMPKVATIGDFAFSGTNLINVSMPKVATIGVSAFQSCTSLESVDMPNVTTIGVSAFSGCTSLVSVTIPVSVTTIEDNAFSFCINLVSVSMPNVTTIGERAFSGTSLVNVSMPNVTNIGGWAFDGCTNLVSVAMPNVTTIGNGVFNNCSKLTEINVDSNNPHYYASADGILFDKSMTTIVVYPPGKTATNYTIPPSVTTIRNHAFLTCTNLESVSMSNVTSIGDLAFWGCTSLVSLIFTGNAPTIIGDDVFNTTGCTIYYPEGDRTWEDDILDNFWKGYAIRSTSP